jgi:hypothetical protein
MCGKAGEACCNIQGLSDCNTGLSCISDKCTTCGGLGEACCPGRTNRCEGGSAVGCIDNKCQQCGDPGEPCCPVSGTGDGCNGRCVNGTCQGN